ncbi:MAG TPA: chorismate mutase [Saprospiraceae bacterium]|jgi:chorismate mutase|nr:bifunctional 3-deoxy-7-phosphoheptulonate synthase/chorismate mutase type II [Saprospiraceae bacterium]WKZ64246.1 MAG: chorismate mutase [Saprospiraceae bacterium]HMY85582.1 chorismate mutase [Saprospiraceae bacterium]HMZ25448.1 chorismate mutase [Saprospiraceae bacterium]HNA77651.1 chorismate mutase [Saprospiraceae bacterium]
MNINQPEKMTLLEKIKVKRPFIIAGPCSAETEQQVIDTAVNLSRDGNVDVLRAGIWKPRTRPGSFEGVGTVGLPWLQKAKEITGLPVAIEVANAKQAEEALDHEIDIVWIGARSTTNPFSVQEIANVLKGVDIPVWIKNPINPDLELWTGAVERIQQSGIRTIGLIHRGFHSYGDNEYRNTPMWNLAIEMRRRYPELLFINDPSHICGNRHMLAEVAQTAVDLAYDGLMIECHIDPDHAWSDSAQQITPDGLSKLLKKIHWVQFIENGETDEQLIRLRHQIDHMDDQIIELLSQRMVISDAIGAYKKEHNLSILQMKRWNEIMDRISRKGKDLMLSNEFIHQYFNAIHMESIRRQNKVINKKIDHLNN